MTTTTICQTYYGPGGETFAVEITTSTGETITIPFWTEREAWDFRDQCLDEGHRARVLGAPCRGTAIVPKEERRLVIDE